MPYEGEYAKHHVIGRIVQNERVQALVRRCVRPESTSADERLDGSLDLERRAWVPKLVVAIDGSHHLIPYRQGFPGAELGFFSLAGVVLDIELLRKLDQNRPANPQEFSRIQEVNSFEAAFPSANMVMDGEQDARSSFRRQLFEELQNASPGTETESLLETYDVLLKHKPNVRPQRCPFMSSCALEDGTFVPRSGMYGCSCGEERVVYSTDALRIHERFHNAGSNGAVFAEIMQVLEHLWLVSYLRAIEKNGWWAMFKTIAFVMDGPLAVFGQPAWISQAIKLELQRLNARAQQVNGEDILLLGIEKTGQFVEHFAQLDRKDNGTPGRIEKGSHILLTDDYIKRNIIFNESRKLYGADTYYGRKLFYKTRSGGMIVAVSPFLTTDCEDTRTAEPEQHPRLADTLDVLDCLVSSRYPNATIPLIAAHAEAAIPARMGRQVLEKLAHDLLGRDVGSAR
jgi:hypothetical protein